MKYPALEFDGVDDYVSVNNVITSKPLTFEAWVKLSAIGKSDIIDSRNATFGAGGKGFVIEDWTPNGAYAVGIGDGTNFRWSAKIIDLSDFKWHCIAVSVTSATESIYVDGVLVGTVDVSALVDSPLNVKTTLDLAHGLAGYANCLIAEVRIYNRALTADEIKQLYYHKPITNGLVLWLMPQRSYEGATWWDRSGYGNHGMIYGATPSATEQFNLPPLRVIAV